MRSHSIAPRSDGPGSFCFGLRPMRRLSALRLIPFCLMTYAAVLKRSVTTGNRLCDPFGIRCDGTEAEGDCVSQAGLRNGKPRWLNCSRNQTLSIAQNGLVLGRPLPLVRLNASQATSPFGFARGRWSVIAARLGVLLIANYQPRSGHEHLPRRSQGGGR